MSVVVRNGGWVDTGARYFRRSNRAVLPTTTGTALAVVLDPNHSTAINGDKSDVAKFYIYESNSTRSSWTLRATVTPAAAPVMPLTYSADLFANNSIGIAYIAADKTARYLRIAYGTWGGTNELIATPPSTSAFEDIDISVSDGDVPLVSVLRTNPAAPRTAIYLYTRRTQVPGWHATGSLPVYTGALAMTDNTGEVTVTWIKGAGGSATARYYAVAGSSIHTNYDSGVTLYTGSINEQTGIVAQGATLQGTYLKVFNTKGSYQHPPRKTILFSGGSGDLTFSCMLFKPYGNMAAMRATVNNGTFTVTHPLSTLMSQLGRPYASYGFGMSYAKDTVNFYGIWRAFSLDSQLINYFAKFNSNGTVTWKGYYPWNSITGGTYYRSPMGGTGRNADITDTHDVLFGIRTAANRWSVYGHRFVNTKAPSVVYPRSGSTVSSSLPEIGVEADIDDPRGQSPYKVVWQFAQDQNFTTGLRTYEQPDSKYRNIVGTDVSNVTVQIMDKLPEVHSMPQGTWYVRAALVNYIGGRGAWSAANSVTITHPPRAIEVSPTSNQALAYGAGEIQFNWKFSDSSSDDYQTAYQVTVRRLEDSSVVADTNKVTSADQSATVTIPSAHKNTSLYAEVTLWDRDNVVSAQPTRSGIFELLDGPSVTINAPTPATVLSTGLLSVTFTPATPGTAIRTIEYVRVRVTEGASVAYDSGLVATSGTLSGTEMNYAPTDTIFKNNRQYTIEVSVRDSMGLEGVTYTSVSTAWTPPPGSTGLAVDTSPYNTEDQGYVSVMWSDTNRDDDFLSWVIHRTAREIDPVSGAVLETYPEVEIGRVHEPTATYEFRDYFAPSGHDVTYRVTQVVSRFGDEAESENTNSVTVSVYSDGYWLIVPTDEPGNNEAFQLKYVTSDSYTDEYEEVTYTVIGRGRRSERGDKLGKSGSLTAQIRDSAGSSARQKKRRLEAMKEQNRDVFLRNPFGDLFRVAPGDLGIERLAGVGRSEFVDVTLPYQEVAE